MEVCLSSPFRGILQKHGFSLPIVLPPSSKSIVCCSEGLRKACFFWWAPWLSSIILLSHLCLAPEKEGAF